ncbi:MAG: M24 family metallopeptidase [Alphaproteobacteria bacterium]
MAKTTPRRAPPKFSRAEYETRIERARAAMTEAKLDAIMVTSQPNLPYFAGAELPIAWESPTRPWHLVVPRNGEPVAVIPYSGEREWRETSWIADLRMWRSPNPANEGLDILAKTFGEIRRVHGRIGCELGPESRLIMAPGDLMRLKDMMRPIEMVDCALLVTRLRFVKSKAEIAHQRHICQIVSDAFADLPKLFKPGITDADLVRRLQADILMRGADKTPYMVIGSGKGGYDSTSMGPIGRKLVKGDVFQIDTGSRWGFYFSDFCRNYAVGKPSDEARRAYDTLWRATEAGIKAARPGNTSADLFRAQATVIQDSGYAVNDIGRMGHGLGRNLTEPPSNKLDDNTVLVENATMTIEPSLAFGRGRTMVHEENLIVTPAGGKLLTTRAPREMWVLRA